MILPPPAAFIAAQERAGQVGVDDAVPFLKRKRLRGFADIDAGVVDENVDAAELAADALDHGCNSRFVGDVGRHGNGPGAKPFDAGDRRGRLRLIAPDDRDRGSSFRQPARHAKSDAAIAAGHDRNLAAEIEKFAVHGSSAVPAKSGSVPRPPARRRSRPTGSG
jgi:hypothetical protein